MKKRIFVAAAIIYFALGIFALDGFCGGEKVGILQKVKNAYNNFRNKQQQSPQAVSPVRKDETLKPALSNGVSEEKRSAAASVQKAAPAPKAEAPKAEGLKAPVEKKEMTRDEMLADLKESLSEEDEIFDTIPELKAEKDKDGKSYYTFKGMKLEDLSKGDLDKLSARVHQALVRIRTDRTQRQLETVRRTQNIQRISVPPQPPRTPSQPTPPPSPPRTSAPPPPPSRR